MTLSHNTSKQVSKGLSLRSSNSWALAFSDSFSGDFDPSWSKVRRSWVSLAGVVGTKRSPRSVTEVDWECFYGDKVQLMLYPLNMHHDELEGMHSNDDNLGCKSIYLTRICFLLPQVMKGNSPEDHFTLITKQSVQTLEISERADLLKWDEWANSCGIPSLIPAWPIHAFGHIYINKNLSLLALESFFVCLPHQAILIWLKFIQLCNLRIAKFRSSSQWKRQTCAITRRIRLRLEWVISLNIRRVIQNGKHTLILNENIPWC